MDTAVRNELECPICMEYMVEEIYFCSNGHSICKSCVEKVQPTCPICRGAFADQRNYALEKIAAVMKYPCRICKEELKAENVIGHELNCDSGIYACNTIFSSCKWNGSYSEVKAHIEKCHPQNIKNWKHVDNYQLYILFFDEQPFFVFYKQTNHVSYYSAVFIGPKHMANQYIVNVEFEDQTELGYKLSGSSPCISLCRCGQVFDREKVIFGTEMLTFFLNLNSYYASTLTINKK